MRPGHARLPLKTTLHPGRGEPSGGQCPVLLLQDAAPFSRSTPPTVASSETLQCEGPVSTRDSSCHAGALEDSREKDFRVKGYTFSKPFHLMVSYGEALGLTRAGLLLLPFPKSLLLAPQCPENWP